MSYDLVRQAIVNRQCVRGIYQGKLRIMCPHVIGLSKKGIRQALCYQFAGESKSRPIMPDGSPDNWRCIEIAQFFSVEVFDGPWHTAPNHSRPQTCVYQVDVEVSS